MSLWESLALGGLARFVLALALLGLLRLLALTVLGFLQALRQAGDRRIPWRQVVGSTLAWLFPVRRLPRARWAYSLASYLFHIGLLIASLFLSNHIRLFEQHLGLRYPALFKPLLDGLTLLAIVAGSVLLLYRLFSPHSRRLSRPADYLLLLLLLSILTSGYLAGRPWNPFPYNGLMLWHTLNGMLLVAVIPFSKLAHCLLYPLIRLGSEIAWHFRPQAGEQVVRALHGVEGRRL